MNSRFILLILIFFCISPLFAQFPGDLDRKFNPQDLGFGQGEGFNGPIECVAEQADGKWLVGGRFTSFNGIRRVGFCRFNANGTLDMGFNNGTGLTSSFGANVKVYVKAIKVLPNGKIAIGGYFQRYNGVERSSICLLNANGSLDLNFVSNVYGEVSSIDVQSNGQIIAAGSISYSLLGPSYLIARFIENGGIDDTFQVIPGFSTGQGFGVQLYKIYVDAQDRIWCAGVFFQFGSTSIPYLARLQSNGRLDSTINFPSQLLEASLERPLMDIQNLIDHRLVVTGFNSRVNQILPNGRIDSTFDVAPIQPISGIPFLKKPVKAIRGYRNQYLFLGDFRYIKGRRVKGYAFVRTDGSIDTNRRFLPQLDLLKSSLFYSGLSGKRTLAFGNWVDTLGRPGQSIMILDSTFNTVLNVPLTLPFGATGGQVEKLVRLAKNSALAIGGFSHYNQRLVNGGYVKIDIQTGMSDTSFRLGEFDKMHLALVLKNRNLIVYGTRGNDQIIHLYDSLFQRITPNTSGLKVEGGFINDILEGADGSVYLTGFYSRIGKLSRNHFSRLYSNGFPDSTYFQNFSGQTFKMALYPDGRILVSTTQGFVRLTSSGENMGNFGDPNNGSFITNSMRILEDKKIIFSFSNSLSLCDSSGFIISPTLTTGYSIPTIGSSIIYDFFTYKDKVIFGGDFNAGNINRLSSARLDGFGVDTSFRLGSGFTGNNFLNEVRCLLPLEDGRFLAGGDFTSYKGIGRNRLAKIYYLRADVLTDSVSGRQFCKAGLQKIAYRCQAFEPEDSLRLQISDSSGSFANARLLKTVKARQQDSVSFSFPADILVGNKYRFRWVATAPTAKICFPSEAFGITEALVPNVGLVSSADRDTLCFGDVLKLKLSKQNAGSQPGYRWFVNGAINPNVADSISITAQTQDSLSVRVEMRSSEACVAPRSVQASKKYVTIKPEVGLGPDTNLCQKPGFYTLPLVNNGSVLSWVASPGLSQSGASTTTPGIFSGKLNISTSGCKAVDSVRIEVVAKPILTLSLSNDTIKLLPDGLENIKWFYNNALLPGQTSNQLSNLQTGTYYSIAQNATGCLDTSAVLTFTELRNALVQGHIKLYPQPVKDKLYIEMPETGQSTELVLMDAMGRIVVKEKGRNIPSISVSKLPAGLYQLKVMQGKKVEIFGVVVAP